VQGRKQKALCVIKTTKEKAVPAGKGSASRKRTEVLDFASKCSFHLSSIIAVHSTGIALYMAAAST
jgi:hypothetical protein